MIQIIQKNLPDVNYVPPEFDKYGRFAITTDNLFWVGEEKSSHPPNTKEGFYYALAGKTLYISPRGNILSTASLNKKIISLLLKHLRLTNKFF